MTVFTSFQKTHALSFMITASFVIVLSNPPLSHGQLDPYQNANVTDVGAEGWTTYSDVFHGFIVSHPANWESRNDSMTDGNYTLVTRFDLGSMDSLMQAAVFLEELQP